MSNQFFAEWRSTRGLFVLLALAVLALPAWPQSSNGSVRGTVQDASGAVIPNVAVVLTNTATGVERPSTSNEAGLYVSRR